MPNNLISQNNKEGLSFFYSEQYSIYGEFSSLYHENGEQHLPHLEYGHTRAFGFSLHQNESLRNGTDFDGFPAIKHTKRQTIFHNSNP